MISQSLYSKIINPINNKIRTIEKKIKVFEKDIKNLEDSKLKLFNKLQSIKDFVIWCPHCKVYLEIDKKDLGYFDYKSLRTVSSNPDSWGDFDVRQVTYKEKRLACLNCMHVFDYVVDEPEVIDSTRRYNRHEDKPDFVTPYSKQLGIMKILSAKQLKDIQRYVAENGCFRSI